MEKSNHEKKRLAAELCSCVDDKKSTLHLEFTIPEGSKAHIVLPVNQSQKITIRKNSNRSLFANSLPSRNEK